MLFHAPWTVTLFLALVGLLGAGLVLSVSAPSVGVRVMGAGLAAVALWLGVYDMARRTVSEAHPLYRRMSARRVRMAFRRRRTRTLLRKYRGRVHLRRHAPRRLRRLRVQYDLRARPGHFSVGAGHLDSLSSRVLRPRRPSARGPRTAGGWGPCLPVRLSAREARRAIRSPFFFSWGRPSPASSGAMPMQGTPSRPTPPHRDSMEAPRCTRSPTCHRKTCPTLIFLPLNEREGRFASGSHLSEAWISGIRSEQLAPPGWGRLGPINRVVRGRGRIFFGMRLRFSSPCLNKKLFCFLGGGAHTHLQFQPPL
jgi:hypothetical protein